MEQDLVTTFSFPIFSKDHVSEKFQSILIYDPYMSSLKTYLLLAWVT